MENDATLPGTVEAPWDAIVIGSGIGGLSAAGLLAAVASKRVLVLARHSEPGGLTLVHRGGLRVACEDLPRSRIIVANT